MTDPLLEAVKALRATNGEELASGRYTRARVLASVRQQSRRRVLRLTFGLPLAAILVGSGALAASGQRLPLLVQRVSVALGWREPSEVESSAPRRSALGARSGAEPTPSAAAPLPLSREPAAPPPADPAVTSTMAASPSASATRATTVTSEGVKPLPRDTALTERDLSLYEAAHRAHFVDKDASAALAAWNAYLREVPRGRFVLEARYNRALCLVRLGRNAEARQALEPFSRGVFGEYRRSEAVTLLEELSKE